MIYACVSYKQNENTTELLTATVQKVDIVDTGNGIVIKIHVIEYSPFLFISTNISKNIEIQDIREFKEGEKIFFRVNNSNSQ